MNLDENKVRKAAQSVKETIGLKPGDYIIYWKFRPIPNQGIHYFHQEQKFIVSTTYSELEIREIANAIFDEDKWDKQVEEKKRSITVTY